MAGFFYNLGRMVGPKLRQAQWVVSSLTGTEAEAVQAEYDVGRDLAQALAQQMEVVRHPDVERWLDDIGTRLTATVANKARRFCFRMVKSVEVNAFALPGGFVFLTQPLLELCQWDVHETAFVMGHEMGHVIHHHAIDRLMANSVVSAALSRFAPGRGLIKTPLAGLAASLLNQGYSQDQELDADRTGVQLTHAAGFDATAAARLLARLGANPLETTFLGSYLSSHPPLEVRLRHLERILTPR
jgi:predicted Zn-dependent protease